MTRCLNVSLSLPLSLTQTKAHTHRTHPFPLAVASVPQRPHQVAGLFLGVCCGRLLQWFEFNWLVLHTQIYIYTCIYTYIHTHLLSQIQTPTHTHIYLFIRIHPTTQKNLHPHLDQLPHRLVERRAPENGAVQGAG